MRGKAKIPWQTKAVTLLLIFVSAYWLPLKGIVNTWMTNDDYSYGFLIPIISAYLLWDMRLKLNRLEIGSSWFILPVLLVFLLLSVYGILGSSENVSRPVIPVLIILFAAFCFGTELVKRYMLPLGFLIFMVPMPPFLEIRFGVLLKRISSELGGLIIRMYNIPVHVSGNIIDLGDIQLQVADACSGLRFVFPLFALGIVYAYFFERIAWKRICCVFSTIPIAILTNVLRIGITGILADMCGSQVAQSFFHDFSGWAIFMAAFVFLFLVGRFLRLFPPEDLIGRAEKASETTEEEDGKPMVQEENATFFVSVSLLLMVGALSWMTSRLPPLEIKGGIESFPLVFGDWRGQFEHTDPDIIIKSGTDEAFNGFYRNKNNEEASLYMGYRKSAFLENENFFHSPTVCLPSHGWKNKETSTHKIVDVPFFQELKVTKMVVEKEGLRQLVYFWFQTKNKATPDKNIHRFHLALHAIQRDNTHALFIRPITTIRPNEKIKDAEERMDRFVKEMTGPLIRFLKERVKG